MKIVETASEMKDLARAWRQEGHGVGFVPTMGALHAGHASLVERAGRECARVAVSLFVNPTQFNDRQDFANYPKTLDQDLALLAKTGTHAVFLPRAEEIYSDQNRFSVVETETSQVLCGSKRPGHFRGVLTVVMKLLNIVTPDRAYFGEKDFQQLRLIQEMTQAFFMNVEIVPCPTRREADGLAMSSRNLLLTPEQRRLAPRIFQELRQAKTRVEAARRLEEAGFRVDYVEDIWGRRFAAAFLGDVRLIDNVEL